MPAILSRSRGATRLSRSGPTATLALLCVGLAGCPLIENYPDPAGPRFAADYIAAEPPVPASLRVVTFNLKLGEDLTAALAALQDPPLAGADLVLMQEMDSVGVDELARSLGLAYVYYPASRDEAGRGFGNAVLSRWHLVGDRKIVLPWTDPYNNRLRIAVIASISVGGAPIHAGSMHTAVPANGLGARLEQSAAVIDSLANESGAIVLGGDLNTSDPDSVDQTVELFASRGYTWASSGVGDTISTPVGGLALDHLFVKHLLPISAGVYREPSGSDHFPVWVELGFSP